MEARIREVLVYDPKRKPVDWPGSLGHDEAAIFLSEANSGEQLNLVDGKPERHRGRSCCYVTPDLLSAQAFCERLVLRYPFVKCEVFDGRGRSEDPLAILVHPSLKGKEENSPARGKALLSAGLVSLGVSGPLFYLDAMHSEQLIWPSLIGVTCIGLGLRLVYWGWSILSRQKH